MISQQSGQQLAGKSTWHGALLPERNACRAFRSWLLCCFCVLLSLLHLLALSCIQHPRLMHGITRVKALFHQPQHKRVQGVRFETCSKDKCNHQLCPAVPLGPAYVHLLSST